MFLDRHVSSIHSVVIHYAFTWVPFKFSHDDTDVGNGIDKGFAKVMF